MVPDRGHSETKDEESGRADQRPCDLRIEQAFLIQRNESLYRRR